MSLTPPINDIALVWDEVNDTDFDRYEIWRAPNLPIVGITTGTKTFYFEGMYSSWFQVGESVIVSVLLQ